MNNQNQPRSSPIFRLELAQLFGKLLMLYIVWWAWGVIAGYWMLWAAILSVFGGSALITLWRVKVAWSYRRQNQLWHLEAQQYIFGKTSRLAQLCDDFMKRLMGRVGHFIGALDGALLFYDPWASKAGHMAIFGPARSGKSSTSCIGTLLNIFNILRMNFSVWVNDCKGELYFVTAAVRRYLGHRIIALNPFGMKGIQVDTLNPFDEVTDSVVFETGEAHEWADIIAQAMIVEPEDKTGDNFVFRENGRRLLITLILYLAVFDAFNCNPVALRELVMASDEDLEMIANKMRDSDKEGGLIKTYGNMLLNDLKPANQKLFYSFKVEAVMAVKIYDGNTKFGRSTMRSTFKLEELFHPKKKVTMYQITPQAYLGTHGAYATLVSTLIIEKMARLDRRREFLMIYDEMGNMPQLPKTTLKKAITLLPGLGLRLAMYFQSLSQLNMYGKDMAKLVLDNCGLIQAWGITDPKMAEEFSRRSGKTTVKKHSYRKDPKEMDLYWSLNMDEKEEPVLSETEILQARTDEQFVLIAGQKMIKARRIPFWKVALWREVAQKNPCEPYDSYPKEDAVEWQY